MDFVNPTLPEFLAAIQKWGATDQKVSLKLFLKKEFPNMSRVLLETLISEMKQ